MIYLTPGQLRAMDLGVKLDALTDAQLASWCRAGALAVNAYTNASKVPVPHDFRGGSIVGETHTWPIDPYERDPRRRVFPYHQPILDVTSVRIYATLDQYVEFDADQIYYERSEGWIEPASANMTSFGLFGAAMLPYIGLAHPHIRLDYTYGAFYPEVERLTKAASPANTWRATVGFWDNAVPEVVKVNGVTRVGNYTVDRTEGTVTFTAPIPADGDAIDLTYVGTLHPNIARATGLIAADRIMQRALTSGGLGGLRVLRVAEISLERDFRRTAGKDDEVSIPPEAQDLLAEFREMALAFG